MQSSDAAVAASTLSGLKEDASAGEPTTEAIAGLLSLFGRRGGEGVEMATRSLRLAMPAERVRATSLLTASD